MCRILICFFAVFCVDISASDENTYFPDYEFPSLEQAVCLKLGAYPVSVFWDDQPTQHFKKIIQKMNDQSYRCGFGAGEQMMVMSIKCSEALVEISQIKNSSAYETVHYNFVYDGQDTLVVYYNKFGCQTAVVHRLFGVNAQPSLQMRDQDVWLMGAEEPIIPIKPRYIPDQFKDRLCFGRKRPCLRREDVCCSYDLISEATDMCKTLPVLFKSFFNFSGQMGRWTSDQSRYHFRYTPSIEGDSRAAVHPSLQVMPPMGGKEDARMFYCLFQRYRGGEQQSCMLEALAWSNVCYKEGGCAELLEVIFRQGSAGWVHKFKVCGSINALEDKLVLCIFIQEGESCSERVEGGTLVESYLFDAEQIKEYPRLDVILLAESGAFSWRIAPDLEMNLSFAIKGSSSGFVLSASNGKSLDFYCYHNDRDVKLLFGAPTQSAAKIPVEPRVDDAEKVHKLCLHNSIQFFSFCFAHVPGMPCIYGSYRVVENSAGGYLMHVYVGDDVSGVEVAKDVLTLPLTETDLREHDFKGWWYVNHQKEEVSWVALTPYAKLCFLWNPGWKNICEVFYLLPTEQTLLYVFQARASSVVKDAVLPVPFNSANERYCRQVLLNRLGIDLIKRHIKFKQGGTAWTRYEAVSVINDRLCLAWALNNVSNNQKLVCSVMIGAGEDPDVVRYRYSYQDAQNPPYSLGCGLLRWDASNALMTHYVLRQPDLHLVGKMRDLGSPSIQALLVSKEVCHAFIEKPRYEKITNSFQAVFLTDSIAMYLATCRAHDRVGDIHTLEGVLCDRQSSVCRETESPMILLRLSDAWPPQVID